jgi:hypothetical protein
MTSTHAWLAIALSAAPAVGCQDDITEVLLIVESDLVPNIDVNTISFAASPGGGFPQQFTLCKAESFFNSFPVSTGFVSRGATTVFSTTIELSRGGGVEPLMSRTVTGIRFVREQLRMLIVPMPASCRCMGTSCPNPDSHPECADIENPETVPFDATVAPAQAMYLNPCHEFGSGGGVF